jgi:3,4-dihydroxy 2-butanone 4-phosphate synthase/GTP cyclohydrolase II
VLVRVHEPFSAFDLLDLRDTRHSWSVDQAMRTIAGAGRGVILLLHRTENGQDLLARMLPADPDVSKRKPDLRTYGIGAQILRDLGVARMRVLAHPRRMPSMTGFDLEVTGHLEPDSPTP